MPANAEFSHQHHLLSYDGLSYRPFSHEAPMRIPVPSVILAGTSPYRIRAVQDTLALFGMQIKFKNFSGPTIEEGKDPTEKSLNKALHIAYILTTTGYFDRHPSELLIIISADSVNTHDGEIREKPKTIAQFHRYRDEWKQAAYDGKPMHQEAGYAAVVVCNGHAFSLTMSNAAHIYPPSIAYLTSEFHDAQFEYGRKCAHGVQSERAIQLGEEIIVNPFTGGRILGRNAVDQIYGSLRMPFYELISSALTQFHPAFNPAIWEATATHNTFLQ